LVTNLGLAGVLRSQLTIGNSTIRRIATARPASFWPGVFDLEINLSTASLVFYQAEARSK